MAQILVLEEERTSISIKSGTMKKQLLQLTSKILVAFALLILATSCNQPVNTSASSIVEAGYTVALEASPHLQAITGAKWSFSINQESVRITESRDETVYQNAIGTSDLRIYQKKGLTAYDLILPAGADPTNVYFPLEKHQKAYVNNIGELIVSDQGGYWKHSPPVAYQDLPDGRRAVTCQFNVTNGQIQFDLGQYDPAYELTIDPTIAFLLAPCGGNADELGGRIYHDLNNDGAYDPMLEPGIENATVRLYACTSETPISTTNTDVNGEYTFTGLTPSNRYRLEFDAPPNSSYLPAFAGTNNRSIVQYALPGACDVLVGFLTTEEFCDESELRLILPCYENGSGSGNNNAVMVSFGYDLSGVTTSPEINFTAAELGSIYGTAFFPDRSLVFTSAFLKRHSGLGPRGLDGVYALDYSSSIPSLVGGFNLQGITPANGGSPIDLGNITRNHISGSITGPYDLSSDRTESSIDLDAFAKIGMAGFGDIDMEESGKYLWMTNLHQRALLKIAVDSLMVVGNSSNLPSSGAIEQFPLDGAPGVPSCVNGVLRPFALEFKGNLGYVGCICDASASSSTIRPPEMTGHILTFDTTGATTFNEILNFSFDYPREAAYFNRGDSLGGEWHKWIDTFSMVTNTISGLNFVSAPQPIISDIEVLDNGDLVMAVMDRFAHQSGTQNLTALTNSDSLVSGIAAGDILYAELDNGGSYILEHSTENDPGLPPGVPSPYPGFSDTDGVTGMGEFFWGDYFVIETPTADEGHYETATGGLAYLSGSNEIAATVFDPVSFFSQGIRYFNLTTGGYTRNYRILETDFNDPSGGGKGSSLGDPELICGVPPIQLGNYVWIDEDEDGIQDPCEPPIEGLPVYLYDMNGTQLATTSTQEDGTYYFTEPGTNGEVWLSAEGVQRNTMYYIGFGDSTVLILNDSLYGITNHNLGSGVNPDQNDSDPSLQPGLSGELAKRPVVKITTNQQGGANHSIDAGFINQGETSDIPCVPLSCPGQLNLIVDFDCQFILTPDLLLNRLDVSPDEYEIRILNSSGHLVVTDTITSEHVGKTITFMIYRLGCETYPCYGKLLIEDKTGPQIIDNYYEIDTLECGLESFIMNNPETIDSDSPYYIGEVSFEDNCAPDCETTAIFSDSYERFPCDSLPLTGKLTRRWIASDCNDLETTAEQNFYFIRPDLTDLIKGDDQTIMTCTPELEDVPELAGPYWLNVFGDTLLLSDIDCGGYALQVEDLTIPVCGDNGSFKQHQFYRVFDWCANTSIYVDTITIRVGDFSAPEFTGNAFALSSNIPTIMQLQGVVDRDSLITLQNQSKIPVLSTGPSDCTAAFSSLSTTLQQQFGFGVTDCGSVDLNVSILSFGTPLIGGFPTTDSIWHEKPVQRFNNLIAGIGIGVHALVIEAKDECYQNGRGILFFQVKDQISPVMKCDDEVHVTLTNGASIATGGYARVYPRSLEEGSWDNCGLSTLEVRRAIPQDCTAEFIAQGYDLDQNGQLDEADGITIENGITFTPWEEYAEFFCCDLTAPVKVQIRGTDEASDPLTGMTMSNSSICWLDVIIEDKVDPRILAPTSVTIDCNDDRLSNLEDFGPAQLEVDYCGNMVIQELAATYDLDQCGFGSITRRFQAIKNLGTPNEVSSPIVTQTITLVERNDYSICFPEDVSVTCGNDPTIPGITFSENACDLMAVSIEDNRFTATQDPDACYKVYRTYKIINWCEYNGEAQPTLVNRDWDGFNGTNPGNCANPVPDGDNDPGDEGICVIVRKNFGDLLPDTVYYDRDTDPFNNIPDDGSTPEVEGHWWKVISGSFDPNQEAYYEGNCSSWSYDENQFDSDISGNVQGDDSDIRYGSFGYWVYTQHIVVYDQTEPDVTIAGPDTFCTTGSIDCSGNIAYTLSVNDNCTGLEDFTVTVLLDLGNTGVFEQNITPALDGNDLSGRFQIGTHRLQFRVNDGCGNVEVIEKVFVVEDCKAPAPICLSGISVSLMPTQDSRKGALPIFANELIASDIYDCTGQGEPNAQGLNLVTEYYLVRDLTPDVSDFDPSRPEDHIIVTCDDLSSMVSVELHAFDTAGNHDYCLALISVADNQNVCSEPSTAGAISGGIATPQQELVEGVDVLLSGSLSMLYQTDQDGGFHFPGLTYGHDFTVIPKMDENHMNGVSTFDLVLIQKHILGRDLLSTPYKIIAADINRSGTVTTLDLIQLRKMILNINQTFPSNTSWRFVDADYRFPDPTNPWLEPFPEIKNINNLEGEEVTDFIAIKIGDLNGNVQPNSAAPTEARSTEAPYEVVLDFEAEGPNGYPRVAVRVADQRIVPGFQFTLDIPSQQIRDIIPSRLKVAEMAWFDADNQLTVSHALTDAISLHDEILFYLELTGGTTKSVLDRIRLSGELTTAEAYTEAGVILPIVILQEGNLQELQPTLLHNVPNPFTSQTIIPFILTRNASFQVDVFDGQGQLIKRIRGEGRRGRNEVVLKQMEFPAPGLYFYRLQTDGFETSRSMIYQN